VADTQQILTKVEGKNWCRDHTEELKDNRYMGCVCLWVFGFDRVENFGFQLYSSIKAVVDDFLCVYVFIRCESFNVKGEVMLSTGCL